MNFEKKCKKCGTIQEHSLQQNCPNCGTKNAFDNGKNMKNEEIISNKLGKDFICPKCLSFFGKENVPKKMLKKEESIGCFIGFLLIIPAIILAIPANIIILYLSPQPFFKDAGFILCTIIIYFILWWVYNNPKRIIKKCPICGREGDFILANSKLGMKYVNEKIIKEAIKTDKSLNSNNEINKKENTINDIYSSWNEDKK